MTIEDQIVRSIEKNLERFPSFNAQPTQDEVTARRQKELKEKEERATRLEKAAEYNRTHEEARPQRPTYFPESWKRRYELEDSIAMSKKPKLASPPPDPRKIALQERLYDLVSGKSKPSSWKEIAEAVEIKEVLGIPSYHKFLKAILTNLKPSDPVTLRFIIHRSSKKPKWFYDIGKEGKTEASLVPWKDIKPHVSHVKLRFNIQKPGWSGDDAYKFIKTHLWKAPNLKDVDLLIAYSSGEVEPSLYDAQHMPKEWEDGLKFEVKQIAKDMWHFVKVHNVRFTIKERVFQSDDWKWYVLTRCSRQGWRDWRVEELPRN